MKEQNSFIYLRSPMLDSHHRFDQCYLPTTQILRDIHGMLKKVIYFDCTCENLL